MTGAPRADALALDTNDGVRLTARRWPTLGAARAAVVLVHGFASSSDEPRVVALAEALHAVGHTVLAFDGRGHGTSGGETTLLGDRERFDVAAAVGAIGDDSVPIIAVGASMGAIAVLRYAADTPGALAGIVTVSCPSRWRLPLNARGILSALMTQTPVGRWFARSRMHVRIARRSRRPAPPVELIEGVHVPVAIVHGRVDPFISATDAEELYAAAHEPRRLTLVDDLGHAFESQSVGPVVAAVDWVLQARM